MQEEVNQKVISLSIQGVKITASVLKAALRKFLEMDNRRKQKATQVKMAEKTGRAQEKGREKARKKIEKKKPHGKQTIKQLNAQGVQLSNLKITDENITVSYTHLDVYKRQVLHSSQWRKHRKLFI